MSLISQHCKKSYFEYMKKGRPKEKKMYKYKNNGFINLPDDKTLIIMSDIHSATPEVINDLIKKRVINKKKSIVISLGDMSGNFHSGGNGDAYESYVKLRDNSYLFYFVQGNHDLYNEKCESLKNLSDGSLCNIHKKVIKTIIGKIGGVNGISVKDDKFADKTKHKIKKGVYDRLISDVLAQSPDILITHQPIYNEFYQKNNVKPPSIHFCGHQPVNDYHGSDYTMMNFDNKIAIINN